MITGPGMRIARILGPVLLVLTAWTSAQERTAYPFAGTLSPAETIAARITTPAGYTRLALPPASFGMWLRGLPLKPGRPEVRLFDGRPKANQTAQHAVVDIDTGSRDLQQCADAVMRLRAEYLRATGRGDETAFKFTSGDVARWSEWKRGVRPVVTGNRVTWSASAGADATYQNFRRYLDVIFAYAGSHSLERELATVSDREPIAAGDVFIQGGFPGHAVIVVDVATHFDGSRIFLLAQSYMPAQDVHVLVNPGDSKLSPWYRDKREEPLRTPEWMFPSGSLRRFR